MGQQIKFYRNNKIDLKSPDPVLTVTDATATDTGQTFVDYVRNRNNNSAWITTGSNDAANTQLDVDMVDENTFDTIILVGHNFGAFTIQYYNGSTYVDFSTAINESSVTTSVNEYTFTAVSASKIRLIITGTQVVNADKILKQLIITEKIGAGQFEGWPIVKPQLSLNRKTKQTISGKYSVVESVGAATFELSVLSWRNDADLTIIEALYFNNQSFIVWPCGGDESQFSTVRRGYRLEDFFVMKCLDEFKPQYYKGNYFSGLNLKIQLGETI